MPLTAFPAPFTLKVYKGRDLVFRLKCQRKNELGQFEPVDLTGYGAEFVIFDATTLQRYLYAASGGRCLGR